MILAGAHARPKDLERLRAEAQAVARLRHANIVQIYEVGEADGLPYFSLEFVAGGTLAGKIGLGSATAVLILAVAVVTSVLSWRLNVKRQEAEDNFQAAKLAEEKEAAECQKAEVARDQEKAARDVSDKAAELAFGTLRGFSLVVDAEMRNKKSLAPLRLRIQESTLKDLERLRQHVGDHPLGGRTEGLAG